jgi:glutamate formiminotransferase
MNVKSRYEPDEDESHPHSQHMRGMCGAPFSMIAGPTRLDVSDVNAPNFIQKIFRALGWKTKSDQDSEK